LGMEGTHSKDPKTGTERNYKNNAVHPIGVTNELNTYWDRSTRVHLLEATVKLTRTTENYGARKNYGTRRKRRQNGNSNVEKCRKVNCCESVAYVRASVPQ
ncbi:hypothetical protein RvY_02253-2, partial [Ramazzottius varieornatus]